MVMLSRLPNARTVDEKWAVLAQPIDQPAEGAPMAVGVRLEFEGATQDQYDATYRRSIEADMPAGLILHSAGPIEDGWGVIDFWESREAFDRFAEKRLRPWWGSSCGFVSDLASHNALYQPDA